MAYTELIHNEETSLAGERILLSALDRSVSSVGINTRSILEKNQPHLCTAIRSEEIYSIETRTCPGFLCFFRQKSGNEAVVSAFRFR